MTLLECIAQLYSAQLYCMGMAERQRSTLKGEEYRKAYNAATTMLRNEREQLERTI